MEQIIQQAITGDEAAINDLTLKHKPRLLAKAYTYVKNEQDAQDIVQDTFIKAFNSLHQLKEPKYFTTWLFKILIHECFRALKKKEQIYNLEGELTKEMLVLQQEESTDYAFLHNALASLQKDYQIALVLHYFYDFKVVEIAEMLDKPLNTIKMHLHRGRKALKVTLEKTMNKPLQSKDVKRMLKKELYDLAQKYAVAPNHYELEVEDYRDGRAAFMWQGATKDEGIFLVLDEQGRIDNLSKSPSLVGPALSDDEKQVIAERLLREQYPKALNYLSLYKTKRNQSSTRFYYNQIVTGLPLEGYFCYIEVTDPGEIIDFSYTGYLENPPEMPDKLYDKQLLIEQLNNETWQLSAVFLENNYDSVPETGVYAIYDTRYLTQSFHAVTGESIFEAEPVHTKQYIPFPKVQPLVRKQTYEEIIGITEEWEKFDEQTLDTEYEQLNWRLKDSKSPKNKTLDDFALSYIHNRVKAKIHPETKQLQSFIWFIEVDGGDQPYKERTLQIAAQFIQTYYSEYVPYLKVLKPEIEEFEEVRAFYKFYIEKDGFVVENEFFQLSVSKQTGKITMFIAPKMTVEQIIAFTPSNLVPINDILPIDDDLLRVKLKWDKNYIENDQDNVEMRLIYRIVSKTDTMITGINAQTGDLIYSLL